VVHFPLKRPWGKSFEKTLKKIKREPVLGVSINNIIYILHTLM
jgi:hypothetical protein